MKKRKQTCLDIYFSQTPVELSHTQEQELVDRLATASDDEAADIRNRLAAHNTRFAAMTAKGYQGQGVPLSDLISAANTGLVVASRRFDPAEGVRFITYAVWWIRRFIMKCIDAENAMIRYPAQVIADLRRFYEEVGKTPQCVREIQDTLGVTEKHARNIFAAMHPTLRFSDLQGDGEDDPINNVEDPGGDVETHYIQKEEESALGRCITNLPYRERVIIERLFGLAGFESHTLTQIGDVLGLSRERVRQLRDEAMESLREGMGEEATGESSDNQAPPL